jgi:CheY-like chemotaxis protein
MTNGVCNKVLFVDDDPDDLEMIFEILHELPVSFEVHEEHNGRNALDYLERARQQQNLPCLIVLDINMPVMDGKEVVAIVKNNPHLKNIPIVVFTTSSSQLDSLYFKRYNVEMITKPPSYAQLRSAIKRLLRVTEA